MLDKETKEVIKAFIFYCRLIDMGVKIKDCAIGKNAQAGIQKKEARIYYKDRLCLRHTFHCLDICRRSNANEYEMYVLVAKGIGYTIVP